MDGGWRGLDGKIYTDINERIAADNRWRQQEKQNELLKQQNEIARDYAYQQSIEQEKNRKLQVKLQNEKLEKEGAIEYSRQEHDKEMRLLNLCDNIGISQEFMDSFLDYLYDDSTAYKEEKEKLDKLDTDIKKLKDKASELFDISYNSEKENDSIDAQIRVLNEIKNMRLGNMEYSLNRDDTYALLSSKINSLVIWGVLAFISGVAMFFNIIFLIDASSYSLPWITLVVEITIIVIYAIVNATSRESIIKICDNKISELNKSYKKIDKRSKDNVDDKYYKLEKEKEEIIHKYRNIKLKDFYEFRTKHYNSQVEKFFIDYGFKDRFGTDFKVVTKSQAKSNGDVDDYIDYFNSVIDNK